jgi:hypothetical protein
MIETVAVPILMKAVDLLFGETKKILEERRAARQSAERQIAPPPEIPLLDQDKQTVVKRQVSEELATRQEGAIKALLDEIAIYQVNYQRLSKRVALEGGRDYAPVNVLNQLEAQEDAILERSQRLAQIVDGVAW